MKYMLLMICLLVLVGCTPDPVGDSTASQHQAASQPGPSAPHSAPASAPEPPKDSIAGLPIVTYLTGKFDPAQNPHFVVVADRYTDGDPYLLHADTYAAFERMHAAAAADGVKLKIVSATRNFDRQKQIWQAKWNGHRLLEGREKANLSYPDPADRARAILRYSSMPGTSRHHWGTDIDLNALTNSFFDEGEGREIYQWLSNHAAEYGFCQPYTPNRPTGYQEERWHWSYLPLATQLSDYARNGMRNEQIGGFDGAEAAASIDVITNYVLGINPACK